MPVEKFAIGVTKLMPPDEIRRFDGILSNNPAQQLCHYTSVPIEAV